MQITVQDAPFDPGEVLRGFHPDGAGAIVTFTGVVRDDTGDLQGMTIEHYPGMTEKALRDHAHSAKDRFGLLDVLVIHRHGDLSAGEVIMMVATAARHRKDAFAGADYLMDYLKSRAPFWKKERMASGAAWVDAKAEDEAALDGWTKAL